MTLLSGNILITIGLIIGLGITILPNPPVA